MMWFMFIMLSSSMPPLIIDMPSKEICLEVLKLNPEYKGAACWAKPAKVGESIDEPSFAPQPERESF